MTSAIYEGWLRHRRSSPKAHDFKYRVFMPFLRLDELPALFDSSLLWSARGPAPARFKRSDFYGDPGKPLDEAVRDRVLEETGERPEGPIYLLANLRYFGFITNPIACYYCYDKDGETLRFILAEVTNTPWNERHSYILRAPENGGWLRTEFDKSFHVSPFHPMDMQYHWHSNDPGEKICLHLANHQQGKRVFDATLSLQRREISPAVLRRFLWRYPVMTCKVIAAIYWEALKIWLKGNPYHPHPPSTTASTARVINE